MFPEKPSRWFALTDREILSHYANCCFPSPLVVGESALSVQDLNPADDRD